MKAAFIQQPGTPETIQFGDLPQPQPGARQVLVKVCAVSVNPIDTYIRGGLIPMAVPFPYIPGCDLAGVVEQAGEEARRFQKGDRVWCSNQGLMGRQGTFAEYAAVDEHWLHLLPEGVTEEQGAAAALVGITAHLGLVTRAALQPGEVLFVVGGTGGVGSTVVQMGKALGARVITTAGSEAKAAAARELGADQVVNYRTQDLAAELKRLAPDGVNVWWETRRQPDFELAVPLLAKRGRFVLMAGREAKPVFPAGPFYVKDCALHGFAMFNASPEEQQPAARAINEWLADGRLKPRIDRVLPLKETAAAHRLQEDNTLRQAGTLSGKIVLRP